jgi:hypothetical protein
MAQERICELRNGGWPMRRKIEGQDGRDKEDGTHRQ